MYSYIYCNVTDITIVFLYTIMFEILIIVQSNLLSTFGYSQHLLILVFYHSYDILLIIHFCLDPRSHPITQCDMIDIVY